MPATRWAVRSWAGMRMPPKGEGAESKNQRSQTGHSWAWRRMKAELEKKLLERKEEPGRAESGRLVQARGDGAGS